jgi:cytochrome c biogenesis protein CcmG/thiol:disulfide interchange protein DsbE
VRLRAAGASIAFALAVASCSGASSPSAASGDAGPAPSPRVPVLAACPAPGTASSLPHARLSCLRAGPKVDPGALGGRPVLVNLWASWCGPCKQEMPSLQAAYATYGTQIAFLGVDTKDSPDSAQDFLAATAVHYPQVIDDNGDLLHGVGGSGLPVTIVLDAAGRTVYSHRGELRARDLKAALVAGGVTNAQG